MPILRLADRYLLEPLIRRMFPEPRSRGVDVRVLRHGTGEWRVVCLAGAFCADVKANWSDWVAHLGRRFPETEIAIVTGFYFYWPEEADVMRDMIAQGQTLFADHRPTIIIAFSFGGLLAKAMVEQADLHNVRAIITMATEHRGHLPRIAETRDRQLEVPMDTDTPIYSFGGWLDLIVWPWTSFTDRSIHRFLWVGHFDFMRSSTTRDKVLNVLEDIFSRHGELSCQKHDPKPS